MLRERDTVEVEAVVDCLNQWGKVCFEGIPHGRKIILALTRRIYKYLGYIYHVTQSFACTITVRDTPTLTGNSDLPHAII